MQTIDIQACRVCTIEKPMVEFYRSTERTCGRSSTCSACTRASAKEYRDANKPQIAAQRRRTWDKHKESYRERALLKKYGITRDEYNALLEGQNGVCHICQQKPDDRELAVDHCHTTGCIRGLLCIPCNVGIGNLGDDPELLRRAADYLEGTL